MSAFAICLKFLVLHVCNMRKLHNGIFYGPYLKFVIWLTFSADLLMFLSCLMFAMFLDGLDFWDRHDVCDLAKF